MTLRSPNLHSLALDLPESLADGWENVHGTTESQVMILKPFPSRLLHPGSPVLQDRISLPFPVLQALIFPKIVFWLLPMPSLSQLPLGTPVAPGIRWVPVVFICWPGQRAKNRLELSTRDQGSPGSSLCPCLIPFPINLLSH